MSRKPRTLVEICREGFRALLESLGPADALRFMQQYDPGHGNYTKERHEWLDGVTVEELLAGIEQRQTKRDGASDVG